MTSAFVDTTSDDDSYLFYEAKVRSLRGVCNLRMDDSDELLQVIAYLVAKDNKVEVTVSNSLGQEVFKMLEWRGYHVKAYGVARLSKKAGKAK